MYIIYIVSQQGTSGNRFWERSSLFVIQKWTAFYRTQIAIQNLFFIFWAKNFQGHLLVVNCYHRENTVMWLSLVFEIWGSKKCTIHYKVILNIGLGNIDGLYNSLKQNKTLWGSFLHPIVVYASSRLHNHPSQLFQRLFLDV